MRPRGSSFTIRSMLTKPDPGVLTTADHFAHREAGGLVVDLYWTRRRFGDEFRVRVMDGREGTRFVLRPPTGREAIQAFYHPFAAARRFAV